MKSANRSRVAPSHSICPPFDLELDMDERWARPWLHIVRDEFRIGRRRLQRFLEDPAGEAFDLLLAFFGYVQVLSSRQYYALTNFR